jgi:hypothetical protein
MLQTLVQRHPTRSRSHTLDRIRHYVHDIDTCCVGVGVRSSNCKEGIHNTGQSRIQPEPRSVELRTSAPPPPLPTIQVQSSLLDSALAMITSLSSHLESNVCVSMASGGSSNVLDVAHIQSGTQAGSSRRHTSGAFAGAARGGAGSTRSR